MKYTTRRQTTRDARRRFHQLGGGLARLTRTGKLICQNADRGRCLITRGTCLHARPHYERGNCWAINCRLATNSEAGFTICSQVKSTKAQRPKPVQAQPAQPDAPSTPEQMSLPLDTLSQRKTGQGTCPSLAVDDHTCPEPVKAADVARRLQDTSRSPDAYIHPSRTKAYTKAEALEMSRRIGVDENRLDMLLEALCRVMGGARVASVLLRNIAEQYILSGASVEQAQANVSAIVPKRLRIRIAEVAGTAIAE